MFQFPGFPSYTYLIQYRIHGSSPWGFPHSEICGSKLICSSPQLIAACRVLLRLLMPRHSPYALVRLNLTFASSSLYELLEFHKTNNCYFGFSLQWKGFILFIFDWFTPPFRWNCNFTQIGKTINWFSCISLNLNCPLICSFLTLQYSLFGFQWT